MKVRVARQPLAAALSWSSGQLEPKPTVPALAGLLLEADGDTLTIIGANAGNTTRSVLEADVLESGRIVIPGRLAASVVATYKGDLVDITVDGQRAKLQGDRDQFLMTLLPTDDYPTPPKRPAADGAVPAAEFTAAIAQVAVAMTRKPDIEMWKSGIQLTVQGDRIHVWATDRYRMAECTVAWSPAAGGAAKPAALVYGQALVDAVRGVDPTGDLELTLSGDVLGIGDGARYSTLVRISEDGRKDPHQFLPKEFGTEAVVEVGPLIAAVKRACLVAGDKKPKVLLGFGGSEISVRAAGDDTGALSLDVVDGRHEYGPACQIAFMPSLLLDGLMAVGTDEARIGLTSPVRPALIHAVGDDTDYRHLVMPVRL